MPQSKQMPSKAMSQNEVDALLDTLDTTDAFSIPKMLLLTKAGADVTIIDCLEKAGMMREEIHQNIIPRRTLTHRLRLHSSLSSAETCKSVRTLQIIRRAKKVFGNDDAALRWLRKPKHQLDGRSPMQVMETELGRCLIDEWLTKIDQGMAA
jgi:putative toxin-antitoxin system antitoxin component (TIGR02293 family)